MMTFLLTMPFQWRSENDVWEWAACEVHDCGPHGKMQNKSAQLADLSHKRMGELQVLKTRSLECECKQPIKDWRYFQFLSSYWIAIKPFVSVVVHAEWSWLSSLALQLNHCLESHLHVLRQTVLQAVVQQKRIMPLDLNGSALLD